jgi:adenylyl-sulfate kinase
MNNPKVLWFTGLSGAGKSTIAKALSEALIESGHKVSILGGDALRQSISKDLGFSDEDRIEQMRRVIALAKSQLDVGAFVITALISPFKTMRDLARKTIGQYRFIEVYINTPLVVCEERDTKGLYKKARLGLIEQMTGIDSVYEAPTNPEVTIDTSQETIDQSVLKILNFINNK